MTSPIPTRPVEHGVVEARTSWNGTSAASRTVANVALASAGVAAAAVVISRPERRRLAGRLPRIWVGAGVPMYLLTEIGRAWVQSGPRAPGPAAT